MAAPGQGRAQRPHRKGAEKPWARPFASLPKFTLSCGQVRSATTAVRATPGLDLSVACQALFLGGGVSVGGLEPGPQAPPAPAVPGSAALAPPAMACLLGGEFTAQGGRDHLLWCPEQVTHERDVTRFP